MLSSPSAAASAATLSAPAATAVVEPQSQRQYVIKSLDKLIQNVLECNGCSSQGSFLSVCLTKQVLSPSCSRNSACGYWIADFSLPLLRTSFKSVSLSKLSVSAALHFAIRLVKPHPILRAAYLRFVKTGYSCNQVSFSPP